MRVVIDTNTAVSGFLWKGAPSRLIDIAIAGKVKLVTSEALIEELADVLSRSKFAKPFAEAGLTPAVIIGRYRLLAEIVNLAEVNEPRLGDVDDNIVLACALSGEVDFIVSGDHHLLELGQYRKTVILNIHQLLERLES